MAKNASGLSGRLSKLASRFVGVEQGIACAGTPLERRTFKVRKRAFLFLGEGDAMLKLAASLPEATMLAKKAAGALSVGAQGWVKILLVEDAPPPETLGRWIAESHALMADGSATASTVKGSNPPAAKPSKAKPAKAKSSAAKPSKAKSSAAKPSKAKSSTAKPSKAKSSTAKPSSAKSSAAKPSKAKPSKAKSSTATLSKAKSWAAKP